MPANPADPAPTSERRLRVNRKRILRVIGFPIALALIGWGALHRGWTGNEAGHRAVVAPDAKALTLGSVHFAACELAQKHSGATTRAFCARFAVPENRADPARRTLELRVALIRSDAPAADRDIVVFLAGVRASRRSTPGRRSPPPSRRFARITTSCSSTSAAPAGRTRSTARRRAATTGAVARPMPPKPAGTPATASLRSRSMPIRASTRRRRRSKTSRRCARRSARRSSISSGSPTARASRSST